MRLRITGAAAMLGQLRVHGLCGLMLSIAVFSLIGVEFNTLCVA